MYIVYYLWLFLKMVFKPGGLFIIFFKRSIGGILNAEWYCCSFNWFAPCHLWWLLAYCTASFLSFGGYCDVLISNKAGLWEGGNIISLACLGSFCVINGKSVGVVFHINALGTDVEYFPSRNGENRLPQTWIFPSIVRVA